MAAVPSFGLRAGGCGNDRYGECDSLTRCRVRFAWRERPSCLVIASVKDIEQKATMVTKQDVFFMSEDSMKFLSKSSVIMSSENRVAVAIG